MNTKKMMLISFMCIAYCNMYGMDKKTFYGIKESIIIMEKSDFQTFTQTQKFQEIIKKPEFFVLTQAPEFQALMKAMLLQSYDNIQEALEGLLETEALKLIFETGIFSNALQIHYNILLKTDAYDTYNRIKTYHKEWGTPDTQSVLNDCKIELRNAKEYTDLIDAVSKEMFLNNSHVSSDTEKPLTRAEQAFLKMEQTPQYQAYDYAKKLHEKHNTPETKNLLEEALKLSLETEETQLLLQIKNEEQEKNNKSQIYSYNVVTKNRAMEATQEYKRYQEAKEYHEKYNTIDSQAILDLYKEQFHATKECQEFVKAVDQEAHITHNIINSEKWKTEQKYSDQKLILCMQNSRNNAWRAATNTKEYKELHDAANAEMFTNNSTHTFSAATLEKYQAIKSTSEYTEYQRAKQLHEKNNSDDPQDIICYYLDVLTAEEGYDLLKNINQEAEKSVLNNIIQSEKWVAEQKYHLFPMLKSTHDRTSLLQVKVIDFLFNKLEAQLSLTQSQKNNTYNTKTQSQTSTNSYGVDLKTIAQPQSHTATLSFQEQELNTYQNPKWLREQINKIAKDKNKAWIAYTSTNEYRRLEQARKQKPCPDTFLSIAHAQERANTTQQARNYRKLNGQLNYLDKELNKLIKNEYKPQNQPLRLSNNNNDNNA